MSTQETYESLNLEPKPIQPHILAASTIVIGDDYYGGRRETVSLSGFVQLNKWPMEGFKHTVDEKGYASFETELISAPEVGIKGYSYELDDRIQVLSNPFLPNSGHVKQVVPGQNFPAEFYIRRFGILEAANMRLAHRDVIGIRGVVDSVPPWKQPLSSPYMGTPRGDGPFDVALGSNVVGGENLPEAWFPANDSNQPTGDTPELFFAPSAGPCMSMLVDPSLIVQASLEGDLQVEVGGKTVTIELSGDHRKAAGAEVLLFAPDKHAQGQGILAQLARMAMVGDCPELGGRVMLRASWPRVSKGTFGEGTESSMSDARFPGALEIDAELDLSTPQGTFYGANPVHLGGQMRDMEAVGTQLSMSGADAPMVTEQDEVKARITGLKLKMSDAYVGKTAAVNS